jgi:hypothetical protein
VSGCDPSLTPVNDGAQTGKIRKNELRASVKKL